MTLSPALAKKLRKAAECYAERDRLILEAHQEGHSLREIAEHAGITYTGVRRVIVKETEK